MRKLASFHLYRIKKHENPFKIPGESFSSLHRITKILLVAFFIWTFANYFTIAFSHINLFAQILPTYGAHLSTTTGDPSTEVTVTWKTSSLTPNTLRLGTSSGDYPITVQSVSYDYPDADTLGRVCCMHAARATGLTPATTYYYQVESGGAWSSELKFKTAPAKGSRTPFTFLAIADQSWDENRDSTRPIAVASSIAQDNPELIIVPGDLFYADTNVEVDRFFDNVIRDMASKSYYMAATGNHEMYQPDGAITYLARFNYPGRTLGETCVTNCRIKQNNADNASEIAELWYSYDWGNVHFVSMDFDLDHGTAGKSAFIHSWLKSDLEKAKQDKVNGVIDWTVAYSHYCFYNHGKDDDHASDDEDRVAFEDLLEQNGVDLFVCGHQHAYERTFPVANNGNDIDVASCGGVAGTAYTSCTDPQYPIYLMVGTAGRGLYNPGQGHDTPWAFWGTAVNDTQWSAFKDNQNLGHARITVNGGEMTVEFVAMPYDLLQSQPYDSTATPGRFILDRFTITKSGVPSPTLTPSPVPTTPTPTPDPLGQTTLGTLNLASTYESVSVYANFSDDTNANNNATLEYRKTGDVAWKKGMQLTPDRRDVVFYAGSTFTNTFKNQWRGSILSAQPDTEYEVRITWGDPDGVVGTNPMTGIVRTWKETSQIQSTGNTYYVSVLGSDTTGSGTEANPWRTIQKGVDSLVAGDTLLVKAGTYPEKVRIATGGTSSNYVTIRNFGTDTVTITPPGCTTGTPCRQSGGAAIGFIIQAKYVRLQGFRITDSFGAILVDQPSEYVVIENNYATRFSGGYAVKIGSETGYSDLRNVARVTVQNNTFEATEEPTDQDYGIIGVHNNRGNHVFRNNTWRFLYGPTGTHGEDCISSTENGEYTDNYKDTDIYNNLCIGSTDDSIEADGSNVNTRIWGNTIREGNLAVSFGTSQVGPTYYFRNLNYDLKYSWTDCVGIKTGRTGDGHVYIYHNVFYITDRYDTCPSTTIIDDRADRPGSKNIIGRNNVFVLDLNPRTDSTRYMSFQDTTTVVDFDYNVVYDFAGGLFARVAGISYSDFNSFVTGTGFERNGINAIPQFVDTANGDFHLVSGSPGINQGTILYGFNDPDSAWPYQGSAPDTGAFETSGLGGGPTPTPAPTSTPTSSPVPTSTPTPPIATPTPTPFTLPVRIDTGSGAQYTDGNNNIWRADIGFSGGTIADRGAIPIANTADDKIYQTERWGMSGYTLPVPNGDYTVNLHFAETFTGITGIGQRVFNINVEGVAINNLDIYSQAGGRNIALIKTANVTVTDGQVNIVVTSSIEDPLINGIEVLSASGETPTPTPTPTPVPIACAITSASWVTASNPVTEGTIVTLSASTNGSPLCDGKEVAFEVRENDSLLEGGIDDTVSRSPASVQIVGSTPAVGTWVAEFQDDCLGLCNPPEYYFNATLIGETDVVRSLDPLLEVNKAEGLVIIGNPVAKDITESSVTIEWETNIESSSMISYGLRTQYKDATLEEDTSSRTTSHSIAISDLQSCALYHYLVGSREGSIGIPVTRGSTFVTNGCNGSVIDSETTDTVIDYLVGRDLDTIDEAEEFPDGLILSIPSSFLTNDANFQILRLNDDDFVRKITSIPSGLTVANHVYHLNSFLEDEDTEVENFIRDLTISIKYEPSDVEGIDQDTLAVYEFEEEGVWRELPNCSKNKEERTVTCTTSSFSDFVLLGKAVEPTPTPESAYTTPSYGSPSYGSPSYGSPSYGSPSYGSPSYGTPSYGTPSTGTIAGKVGDLNNDGRVNIFDLSVMLRFWNRTGSGDLNGDGKVNIFDLSTLLRYWNK